MILGGGIAIKFIPHTPENNSDDPRQLRASLYSRVSGDVKSSTNPNMTFMYGLNPPCEYSQQNVFAIHLEIHGALKYTHTNVFSIEFVQRHSARSSMRV